MMRVVQICVLLACSLVVVPDVFAADTWSDPAPGVRLLLRTAPGPRRIHAAVVDLSRADLYIRATRPGERGQTTSSFAAGVGAVVAINGDFYSAGYQPVGLAVGAGEYWEGTTDNAWSFIACNVEKQCFFDDWPTNREHEWRWHDVVGGNGWRLLIDGQMPAYPNENFYNVDLHPRSGVGVSQDGKAMIFVVVEGRRSDSVGATFPYMASLMQELGAYQALMLDGGGSSTLSVAGGRVNQLPSSQGSERVVANHLAIVRGGADARCAATPNGRYCEGTVINTCQGSQHMGSGDCAVFGSTCQITADGVGVCVHPFCVNGPDGNYCENEAIIHTCEYGRPKGSGDCSFFGASCEQSTDAAFCVHPFCTEGGNATWCKDDATLGSCTDGAPADDVDCAATGLACSGALGACIDPRCVGNEDGDACVGSLALTCEGGVAVQQTDCASMGQACREGACDSGGTVPTVPPGEESDPPGGGSMGGDGTNAEDPGSGVDGAVIEGTGGGCSTHRGADPIVGLLLAGLFVMAAPSRRRQQEPEQE